MELTDRCSDICLKLTFILCQNGCKKLAMIYLTNRTNDNLRGKMNFHYHFYCIHFNILVTLNLRLLLRSSGGVLPGGSNPPQGSSSNRRGLT